jgi:NADH-quinone oxidoreductase subunit L
LRFEHYVQPVGAYFPALGHVDFNWYVAIGSTAVGVLGILLAYAYWFAGRGHGATERNRVALAGYNVLVDKYGFDLLYTDIIAAGMKGPIARASNWFNQNVIDGVVNGTASVARYFAHIFYDDVDQKGIDGAINGSGLTAEGAGQLLRKLQNGKVQQYGALLFGGAVVLAGVLIFAT